MLGDYVVVLGWADRHEAAMALLGKVSTDPTRRHTFSKGLRSRPAACNATIWPNRCTEESMAHSPDRAEPQVGLVRTLVDAGRLDRAAAIVKDLHLRFPARDDVLEAYADVAAARRDYFGVLAAYQAALVLKPTDRKALRGKVLTLAYLNAPQLAIEIAERHPGLITADEKQTIAADRTARLIRWGEIAADAGRGAGRFAALDRALADSEAAAARALTPDTELTVIERRLAYDRICALRARYRMRDAIALYEAMAARPPAAPAYVKSAAASAYLYVERPEIARDLYREAVATDPGNLESQLGLFYALAESEDHDAAVLQVERVVAMTPQWIDAWSRATVHENPAYARALSARAMAPLFANRTAEAEQRLHALAGRAPFNMEIRTDHASAMRARGWPRAAEQEMRWVLAADPANSGTLGERAGALLEMNDFRNAESSLALAQSASAEDGRVVRAGRLWQVHNLRELIVDASFGRSADGPSGTGDRTVDTWLYSRPLDYNYRVFGHLHNAQAKFDSETARRNRAGVGVEYRSPRFTASGELSHDAGDGDTGVAASLAFTPDDHWTFCALAETRSPEAPLRAQLTAIHARRGAGEIVWQASEARSAAVAFDRLDFSDGNRRDTVQGRWTERVVSGPVYKLEVTAMLYASRNSLATAPYFNPSRDFSPTLEFASEWLQWRRYTRAFRHRLVATVGSYRQEGFGSGPVRELRYEQEWTADDRLTVRYGIGRSVHPYDGAQSGRDYGYLSLNWRF
jgi:biofilm PGA synthesis protein PgaA